MKFAVGVLMFDCDKTIVKMLDNCGKFVDKIYVTYSPIPWSYNMKSRIERKNHTDKNIIHLSKYFDKIELIEGTWKTDEDQRNEILNKAKSEGYDYLIIQDADEFYTETGYSANLRCIIASPFIDLFLTEFRPFWKDIKHVLVNKKGKFTGRNLEGYSEFAINLKSNVRFIKSRTTDAKIKGILPGPCYHLSYVHSDPDLWRKITNFAHVNEFNTEKWFKQKWLDWKETTTNLHPLKPRLWKKAVLYNGELPKELEVDLND